jgi:hypothetical protein
MANSIQDRKKVQKFIRGLKQLQLASAKAEKQLKVATAPTSITRSKRYGPRSTD